MLSERQMQLVVLQWIVVFELNVVAAEADDLPIIIELTQDGVGAKIDDEFGAGFAPGTGGGIAAVDGFGFAACIETDGPATEVAGLIFFVPEVRHFPIAGRGWRVGRNDVIAAAFASSKQNGEQSGYEDFFHKQEVVML